MTRSATRSLRSPLPAPAGRLPLARPAAPPADTDPSATDIRDPAGLRPAPRTPHPPAVPAQPHGSGGRAGPAAPDPHPAGGSPPWADPIRGDPSPDRVSFGPIPATGSRPRFAPPPASRTRSTTVDDANPSPAPPTVRRDRRYRRPPPVHPTGRGRRRVEVLLSASGAEPDTESGWIARVDGGVPLPDPSSPGVLLGDASAGSTSGRGGSARRSPHRPAGNRVAITGMSRRRLIGPRRP